jgi:hypothetical protein
MSPPELPVGAGEAQLLPQRGEVDGRTALVWLRQDGPASRQFIFVDEQTMVPVSVRDEYFVEEEQRWVATMTWIWSSIVVGPLPADLHARAFSIDEPFSHKTCARHIGGWPYIHAFHWFLRI